ncbi:PDR/VanB family oxidoreductase [Pseudoxanthomonas sp. JBR18]|uniref:PDR/VanB family oxidoreductase n=1 Tax=Pseudoxanthomonas sp. JBR18 TaxID=2969308 RepID=UPI002304EDD1|nr:PDR/VanB family oxidoreductase [Pseudoxanthomonas sp. JBR18]WCE05544.1 PDR/VanB family oxidoreductase [Pseudoxanthomonas sp. JBR18]
MIEVQVVAVREEGEHLRSFELRRTDGGALPTFEAGAHIDVQLPGKLTRQYSLCNAPHETHRYLICVLRESASRGGSEAMHALAEGGVLTISAPRNLFALHPAPAYSLLFAGGIGITPLIAMAEHLARNGRSFELHYSARGPGRAAFLERLRAAPWGDRVHLHFDDGPAHLRLDVAQALAAAPDGAHLYVCGPAGFIDHVFQAAEASGWDPARLHREYFSAAPSPVDAGEQSFEVQVASSGEVHTIPPGRSIAQVLDEAGVFVPVSCEQGICGTCVTAVLEGTPDHRDQFLSADEHARNDQITLCCSRARSARLVLDL